jgi:hypothetical protein
MPNVVDKQDSVVGQASSEIILGVEPLEHLAALRIRSMTVGLRMTGGSRPQSVLLTISDGDFFKVPSVEPAVGPVFTEDECRPGRDAVIVFSHGFAQNYFGSPMLAVSKQLQLSPRTYQVIGVMPPRCA